MQYGIRSEQAIETVGELFSVVASERQPRRVGRARSQAVPSKRITGISTPTPGPLPLGPRYRPLLSSIQMVNSRPNECASLYVFCNEFQVKM